MFNASNRAESTYGVFNTMLVSIIKTANIAADDGKGKTALKERVRTECGLSSEDMKKVKNDKGVQVYKPKANRFIASWQYAWTQVHPKPKVERKPKGDGRADSKAGSKGEGSKVAAGMTQRTQAYALVLQDLANAKSHASFSSNWIKSMEKNINQL